MPQQTYRDGIVAFIDVLGWKDVVERSAQDTSLIDRLSNVLARVKGRISQIVSGEGYSHGASAHQFSDAHFLTIDKSDANTRIGPEYAALWCRLLAREYLKEGLLVRGGMTIGQFYDDGFACFGPAVTRAYYLEREVSDPMIVIDPNAKVQEIFLDPEQYGAATSDLTNSDECTQIQMNPLAKTRGGRVFVDYLRTDVSSDARFRPHDVLGSDEIIKVLETLRNSPEVSLAARSKIEWFIQYTDSDWRPRGKFFEQIDFNNTTVARRRLTSQDYALVSTPPA